MTLRDAGRHSWASVVESSERVKIRSNCKTLEGSLGPHPGLGALCQLVQPRLSLSSRSPQSLPVGFRDSHQVHHNSSDSGLRRSPRASAGTQAIWPPTPSLTCLPDRNAQAVATICERPLQMFRRKRCWSSGMGRTELGQRAWRSSRPAHLPGRALRLSRCRIRQALQRLPLQ